MNAKYISHILVTNFSVFTKDLIQYVTKLEEENDTLKDKIACLRNQVDTLIREKDTTNN